MTTDIVFVPTTEVQLSAIIELWRRQDLRQYGLDPALHVPHVPEQVSIFVHGLIQNGQRAFVALDVQQHVRAYVVPTIWNLPQESVLHAFLTPRNGTTQALILPDPEDADVDDVVHSVLDFLSSWWQKQKTTGELLRWPASDPWIQPFLKEQRFLLDSYCAVRSVAPLEQSVHRPVDVTIRFARPTDEEQLVELFLAEMEAHAQTVPCARISQVALQGFRAKLYQFWQEDQTSTDPLFIVVAEQGNHGIVGMAENVLVAVTSDEAPGFTPPGSYGCLDNVSVNPRVQGHGVGRLLVDATLTHFRQYNPHLNGLLLWYNPDNPTASRFWPRLGFQNLWATYQRLPLVLS